MHHWVLNQKDQPHCKDPQNRTFNRSHQSALTATDSALIVCQCSNRRQRRRQGPVVLSSTPTSATCNKTSHIISVSSKLLFCAPPVCMSHPSSRLEVDRDLTLLIHSLLIANNRVLLAQWQRIGQCRRIITIRYSRCHEATAT